MFHRRTAPFLLTEAGLEGLRVSLNRPIVDIEAMPVAPARAAIALHTDVHGARHLVVALRSLESGALAVFAFEGELHPEPSQSMNWGVGFGEQMGFLFDEDMVEGCQTPAAALRCWAELTGEELGVQPAAEAIPSLDLLSEGSDLEGLDDLDELDDLEDLIDTEAHPVSAEVAVPVPLSKFRRPEPEPAAPDKAQLGRIAIVRRRSEPASPEPSFLTRLLGSF